MAYRLIAEDRPDRYRPSVEEYTHFHRDGFLVVRGLVSATEVEELRNHAMDLLEGRVDLPGFEKLHSDATPEQRMQRFTRVHMIHRVDPLMERYMLHPRILDVLEAIIGPDVLALQTMQFYNPPGKGGQGWHQDSVYITTYPDTLIGTWLALDTVDEENGCLWLAPGSNHQPIHPSPGLGNGFVHSDGAFGDLEPVEGISNPDEGANELAPIAREYSCISAPVEPGDVIFFHGHVMHRSYPNRSAIRWRRAFVSHYCNARSWVPWNHGAPYEGDSANALHILARGSTHLPFAQPRFGTSCAANHAPATSNL